jgi:methyl-accepting chemotaxis protein
MKGMKDWRFGTRMSAGFGAVITLMVAVAAIGYIGLARVKHATQGITERDMAKTQILYDIMVNNLESANSLFPIFTEKSDEAVKKYVEPRLVQSKGSAERFKKLHALTMQPEGRALLEALDAARAGYTKERNATLRLLNELKREEAAAHWAAKGMPAMATYRAAMQKNLDYFKKRTQDRTQEIAATNAFATGAIIAGTAIAVLLGAGLAVFITRALLRQLGGEPRYAAEVVRRVADGELCVNVDTRSNDTSSLLFAMKGMTENLERTVRGIKRASDGIATGSREIAAGNADLSQRTEEQASSLEETASSMEELAGTVKQNAQNADQANALAAAASQTAMRGGEAVAHVVATMSAIDESSKKIADIIGVIDGIAFQTNILALNAAVEAARAGEQGRGFAVVASEVRTLAQRSAAAAKEIKTLIADSVARVEEGSRLADGAGATMREIVESVERVGAVISEIAGASREQSAGIDQINEAVAQMDRVTQQNAALVEEAAAAAESMRTQAGDLAAAVAVFRLEARGADSAPASGAVALAGNRESRTVPHAAKRTGTHG